MTVKSWIERVGFRGLMFFLVKGLLLLVIPALIAILVRDWFCSRAFAGDFAVGNWKERAAYNLKSVI